MKRLDRPKQLSYPGELVMFILPCVVIGFVYPISIMCVLRNDLLGDDNFLVHAAIIYTNIN